MCLTSLLLATLLGSVSSQGTVVGIQQERIRFRNGRNGATFRSQLGVLRHIQTLQLGRSDVSAGDKLNFTSITVAEDGSELLAVSSDQGGRFVTLSIQPTRRGRYNIGTAREYPLVDSDGEELKIPNRMSLAVNGTYRRGGQGDLTVAYEGNPSFVLEKRALRFRTGVSSSGTTLDVSGLQSVCDASLLPGVTIARLGGRGDLLFTCLLTDQFLDSYPRAYDPTVPPVQFGSLMGVYIEDDIRLFDVEVTRGQDPIAMAPLKNGDVMIASVVYTNPRKLRISYLTSDQLQEGIDDPFKVINPTIIADIDQADGFEIGVQTGLAVREDPRSGQIFVYSMSDDSFAPEKTLLTTFEWRPTRNR